MCETYAISRSVTFFALPDWAFPKPPHHHGGEEDARLEELLETSGDLTEMLEGYLNRAHEPDQDKIKKFIKLSLLYNILPEETPLHKLRSNHTFATSLKLEDGSLDGEPLRIHVGKSFGFDFRPSVNFVSKVLVPDIPTSNGKHPSGERRGSSPEPNTQSRCDPCRQQACAAPSFHPPDHIPCLGRFLDFREFEVNCYIRLHLHNVDLSHRPLLFSELGLRQKWISTVARMVPLRALERFPSSRQPIRHSRGCRLD